MVRAVVAHWPIAVAVRRVLRVTARVRRPLYRLCGCRFRVRPAAAVRPPCRRCHILLCACGARCRDDRARPAAARVRWPLYGRCRRCFRVPVTYAVAAAASTLSRQTTAAVVAERWRRAVVAAERWRCAARHRVVLCGADLRASYGTTPAHRVGVTMSSSTSPTASDWESTEPSDTSSSGMGCGLSDGEWKLVFLVRNAAVAAAVDPSDEQAAVALAAAESTLRKRGRRRKEQKVAAAASNFEVATMWAAKRVAARERRRRRRMRRCKAASTTCDALTRRMPAAAAEASPTNSVVGEGARSFDTIGWVAACALLYPTGTGAANAAVGTGLLPPVPRATPLRVQNPVVYVPGTGRASSLFLQRMNTMKFKVEPMAPTLSSPEAIAKNLTGFTVKVEPGAHVKVEKDEKVIGGGGKWGGGGGGPAWYEQERGRGDPDEVARREALRTMVVREASLLRSETEAACIRSEKR